MQDNSNILQVRYIDHILQGITNFLWNYHCNTLQYVRYLAEISPTYGSVKILQEQSKILNNPVSITFAQFGNYYTTHPGPFFSLNSS